MKSDKDQSVDVYEDDDYEEFYGIEDEEPYRPPRAPSHLSKRAKKLWRTVVAERVKGIPAQALLLSALEALDRADEAREILDVEGVVVRTGKGP